MDATAPAGVIAEGRPRAIPLHGGTAAALALATWLTACAAQPRPTLAELKALPVAAVHYPGSVGPPADGADSNNKFGKNAAVLRAVQWAHDAPASVLTYYDQQLTAVGWHRNDALALSAGHWSTIASWNSDGRIVTVGIMDSDERQRYALAQPQFASFETMFEVVLT